MNSKKVTNLKEAKSFINKLRPEFFLDIKKAVCSNCIIPHLQLENILVIEWFQEDGTKLETAVISYNNEEENKVYFEYMRDNHRPAFKALVRFAIDLLSDRDEDIDLKDTIFDVCRESQRLAIWLEEVLTEKYII